MVGTVACAEVTVHPSLEAVCGAAGSVGCRSFRAILGQAVGEEPGGVVTLFGSPIPPFRSLVAQDGPSQQRIKIGLPLILRVLSGGRRFLPEVDDIVPLVRSAFSGCKVGGAFVAHVVRHHGLGVWGGSWRQLLWKVISRVRNHVNWF